MRKRRSKLFFYFIATLCLISFTIQQVEAQSRADGKTKWETGEYITKVDNFLVLFDASSSMADPYKGNPKLDLARNFVSRMNQALPDFKMNSALRKFGFVKFFSDENTAIVSGLAPYSKKSYEDALQTITRAVGSSPMAIGINASSDDLKPAQGKIAMIIVSDWDELGNAPAAAAEEMKRQFGDRICIYPIMVGKNPEGIKLMEKVSNAGLCGFVTYAEQVASEEDMAQFVEKVFFTKYIIGDSDNDGVLDNLDKCPGTPAGVKVDQDGCPLDTDGDGVYDYLDKCPGTPAGVKVDQDGCPLDSDKDGVYDYLDKCPGTPAGLKVDKDGCPVQVSITLKIEFDTGKSDIKEKYHEEIKLVADFMKKYPQTNTVIEGHTDNVGREAANVKLSQSRANSVSAYLIAKFGIEKDRLQAVGYGPQKPIASNATAEGKQKNRRVQAVINTVEKK
jgi:OmpA-OmpF porin, OOP family